MERITNVRISTLTKSVSHDGDVSIVSVGLNNGHVFAVDSEGNTHDMKGCGCNTPNANVVAKLLRGVDGITPDMSDYYDKGEIEGKLSQKQDVINDLETIRSNASKGATALQSVPNEYVTESELSAKGYATTSQVNAKQDEISDLDTIRSGAAKGATALQSEKYKGTVTGVKVNGSTKNPTNGIVDIGTVITSHQDISGKVDKVTGKGLSTEDFTTALKTKLESLANYDDTAINEAVGALQQSLNTLLNGNPNDAIDSFNEIIAFLDGIADTEDLASIIASIEQQIAGKMDKVALATVAISGSYNDLSNKPTIPSAVTESTVSGWGFTKNTGTYSKPSGGIPASDLAEDVFLQGEKGDKGDTGATGATGPQGPKGDKGDTGAAGTNGKDGADGEDGATFTPSVDSAGNLSWSNNKGLANPPRVNIKGPKGDAGSGGGTITEIKANGTSIATSGVANIPAATTSAYGVTKLTSSTSSTSTTLAATASAVKAAYDLADSKASMDDVNTAITNAITNAINASY